MWYLVIPMLWVSFQDNTVHTEHRLFYATEREIQKKVVSVVAYCKFLISINL